MSGGNAAFAAYYLIIIVAVVASLIGMRQPIGKMLKMALGWVAIFGVAFLIFAFRGEFSSIGQRLKAEALGSAVADGETLRVPIGEDGHFWVDATINGRPLRLMIDSGASVTTVSRAFAESAGVPIDGRRTVVQTAAGPASSIQSSAEQLEVGSIKRTDFRSTSTSTATSTCSA
ncbi:MAG: aspartyl protease family protein [Pseudomonadota bacterium]